jgi:hypothetical protein
MSATPFSFVILVIRFSTSAASALSTFFMRFSMRVGGCHKNKDSNSQRIDETMLKKKKHKRQKRKRGEEVMSRGQ